MNCPRCGVADYNHDDHNAQARGADALPYDGFDTTFYDCQIKLGGIPRSHVRVGTSSERLQAQPNRSRRLT